MTIFSTEYYEVLMNKTLYTESIKKKRRFDMEAKKTQLAWPKTDWYDDLHSNPVPDRNKYYRRK